MVDVVLVVIAFFPISILLTFVLPFRLYELRSSSQRVVTEKEVLRLCFALIHEIWLFLIVKTGMESQEKSHG